MPDPLPPTAATWSRLVLLPWLRREDVTLERARRALVKHEVAVNRAGVEVAREIIRALQSKEKERP